MRVGAVAGNLSEGLAAPQSTSGSTVPRETRIVQPCGEVEALTGDCGWYCRLDAVDIHGCRPANHSRIGRAGSFTCSGSSDSLDPQFSHTDSGLRLTSLWWANVYTSLRSRIFTSYAEDVIPCFRLWLDLSIRDVRCKSPPRLLVRRAGAARANASSRKNRTGLPSSSAGSSAANARDAGGTPMPRKFSDPGSHNAGGSSRKMLKKL